VFRFCLRDLVSAQALLAHAAAVLVAVVLAVLPGPLSPEQARAQAAGLLTLPLWLPGLWVALGLRPAWPALGPGDAGLTWLRLQGSRLPGLRLAAIAAGLVALLVLQAFTGILVGSAQGLIANREFRLAFQVPLGDRTPVLSRPGQALELDLAPASTPSDLLLRPSHWFGLGDRAPVELDASFVGSGGERLLGRIRFHDAGTSARLALPPGEAGRLRLVRQTSSGAALAFVPSSVRRLTMALPGWLAGGGLAYRHLAWACTLLALGFLLSQFVEATIQELSLLLLAPLVGLLPLLPPVASGSLLAQGVVPWPPSWPLPLSALLLGLAAVGCLPRSCTGWVPAETE
jgi:hypothetical protein